MTGISPGAEFAGYVIEGQIGHGGMGVVYRARESQPDRVIALKVVKPELAQDSNFRARFLREAQIAASIEHPHVIPVLRVGETEGVLFIAMRLIAGRDLGQIIAAEGGLEPERAAGIVDQVADALDAAHEQGLVHRDVKPANVLVETRRRGDHVYLTDFGLTKSTAASGGLTSTGMLVGTSDYMPPEQWRGGRLDARVDVYSLGCLLFEMLTGQVPFPREDHAARMYAHLSEPPPEVSALVPSAAGFDEVIARAMAKDPDERYPSAGDLGYAALAATELRPPTRPERSVGVGEAAPPADPAATVRTPTKPAESPSSPDLTRPARTKRQVPTVPATAIGPPPAVPQSQAPQPAYPQYPPAYGYATPPPPQRRSGSPLALILLSLVALAGIAVGALAASGAFTHSTSTPKPDVGKPNTGPPKTLTRTVTTATPTTVTTATPTTGGSPSSPGAQIAALPNQYGYGLAASSGVHKNFAENAFYEYWQASGADTTRPEQISAWSRTSNKYIGLNCAPRDGVVDCTGLNDLGKTIEVRFTQNAVAIYTASQAQAYAASGKPGPSG